MYTIRFWNIANENIKVAGQYSHTFDTREDALNAANALLLCAHSLGAVEMDLNNEVYPIVED